MKVHETDKEIRSQAEIEMSVKAAVYGDISKPGDESESAWQKLKKKVKKVYNKS